LPMKLRGFRLYFSLWLTISLGAVFAVAQNSTAPANQNSTPAAAPAPAATSSSQAPAGDQTASPGGESGKASTAPASAPPAQGQAGNQQQVDPLKRPVSDKQKKANAKAMKQELSSTYKKWLNEDVRWIITPEELSAFKQLSNDEERDAFIEQFWLRRDPTPDTPENEYKEEHYRRIAYANEHFAAGIPGWRTDRGRIYIMWGPPDEIDAHPSGGTYTRPFEEGGGDTTVYPFEDWRYRYLEGVGQEVILEFVDQCGCGDFHLTVDPNEKDALLNVPGAGLTLYEQQGLSTKAARLQNQGTSAPNPGVSSGFQGQNEFSGLELLAKVNAPPKIKFKDLEEVVNHKINVNLMPFEVMTDYVKVTGDTVLVPVTVQVKNKDITFVSKDGIQRGKVNIFGRVTGLTGKVAQTFEDTVQVDVPNDLLEKTVEHSSLYWKAIPLRPGRYRLDIVVKDVNGDRVGSWSHGVLVPEFNEDRLASSSLILADHMEKVASKSVGAGSFVIGETKFTYPHIGTDIPEKPASFKRTQRMSLWMQVYNLQADDKTKKSSANIEYEIVNVSNNQPVLHATESTDTMLVAGDQITLEKSLALTSFQPGVYKLTVKVADNVSKQQIAPSVKFTVE
jgi:GWxTD domain-containing protein